jgi:ABC-2 type transport system permease protein
VLLGAVLATPVMPLIGAALGFLVRSTAGAVATVMGIMFVPAILGGMLPDWWQEHVLRYLPNAAIDSLAQAAPPEGSLTYLPPAQATAVLAVWLLAFLGAAHLSLTRRDA